MSRDEFPVSVRKAAWKRCGGICECGCGLPFDLNDPKGCPRYDHELPDFLGGTNDLENCKVIRLDHHEDKTRDVDMPHIVKARRGEKKRKGLVAKKAKIPGSRGSGFRKRMDGSVVRVKE